MSNTFRVAIALLTCSIIGSTVAREKKAKKELSVNEHKAKQDFDEIVYNWSQTFAEVLYTTKQRHYKASNIEDAFLNAIDAFISSQDPHSGLLKPDEYKNMMETTSGEFYGLGLVIDNTRHAKDKFLTFIDVVPDGPADKAGIKPLDKALAIDDETLEGMSTDKATGKLKGPRHSKVQVTVMRENYPEPLVFNVTRDVIKEQNLLGFYIPEHNIYYLSLNMFSDSSIRTIEDLLKKATKKHSKGLIIDLRNNSGGLLNAAIDIAGLFIEKDSLVVTTKDKDNKILEEYRTTRKPLGTTNVPIFILVNNYTASAAEILAGCLKIYSEKTEKNGQKKLNTFIVGTRTFGKGSVQEVIPISGGCAVKITMALYFLDNDTLIQGVGIDPDFLVEKKFPPSEQIQWFNKFYGRERSLLNTIKIGKTKASDDTTEADTAEHDNNEPEQQELSRAEQKELDKKKPWAERAKDILLADSQFRETISLINLLHYAQQCSPDKVNTRSKAITFINDIYITSAPVTLEEVKN